MFDTPNYNELANIWPPAADASRQAGHEKMSPKKAIRKKCIDCCCGQIVEIQKCTCTACPMWPFRSGRHPYTSKARSVPGSASRSTLDANNTHSDDGGA